MAKKVYCLSLSASINSWPEYYQGSMKIYIKVRRKYWKF